MNPLTIIFFGPSGSGKGSQAERLIKKLEGKTLYIETGQMFRDFAKTDSLTAKFTKEVVDSGGLMPEFMPIWVWSDFLIKNLTGQEHLIFDGVSRRKEEAVVLDSAIKFYRRENPIVLSIEVSDRWAMEKLLARGRKDDTEEGIQKRLKWYKENVVPAMQFFKNDPYYKFIEINGEQTKEEVQKEILDKIGITSS